jgi:GcrA cell cycle regulator
MDWTQEAIVRLRDMWDQGLSTAEIGRRMGVSKNAITGKVHRLNLPTRPSPIRRDPAAPRVTQLNFSTRPSPIRRDPAAPRVTQLMTPQMKEIIAEAHIAEARKKRRLPKAEERVETDEPPPPAAGALTGTQPAKTTQRVTKCCWPSGDPGTPGFRYCEADTMSGKPYCAEHAAIAYVKPRGDAGKNDAA